MPNIQSRSVHIHEHPSNLSYKSRQKRTSLLDALNEREQDVLALWFCGQTAKESALVLNKSSRTVEYYRDRIKLKLGVGRLPELGKLLTESDLMLLLSRR